MARGGWDEKKHPRVPADTPGSYVIPDLDISEEVTIRRTPVRA